MLFMKKCEMIFACHNNRINLLYSNIYSGPCERLYLIELYQCDSAGLSNISKNSKNGSELKNK